MAITRRQFVTRMGALAGAMGLSQVDIAKLGEVFAHDNFGGPWYTKPSVVWVHGAECTGCSTSVLGVFEDAGAKAFEDSRIAGNPTTAAALGLLVEAGGTDTIFTTNANHPFGHRTLNQSDNRGVKDLATTLRSGSDFETYATGSGNTTRGANIVGFADIALDVISLEYHETINGMAGDLAYKWLKNRMDTSGNAPFVLVVEGAVQDSTAVGAWNDIDATDTPWCSIGMDGSGNANVEHKFDDVVKKLAENGDCIGVLAIGQCATFGGYPACESPTFRDDPTKIKTTGVGASQTPARGVYYHLVEKGSAAANKVVNIPGCPTNPWWFWLSAVGFLVDFYNASHPLGILTGTGNAINPAAVDATRRLKAVYGWSLHGPACTRYNDYNAGVFAAYPGDRGCLQLMGCKGPSTNSMCSHHGWNAQQPHNDAAWDYGLQTVNGNKGGNCVAGGHPCMGCTEKGYPDSMVPFVVRR